MWMFSSEFEWRTELAHSRNSEGDFAEHKATDLHVTEIFAAASPRQAMECRWSCVDCGDDFGPPGNIISCLEFRKKSEKGIGLLGTTEHCWLILLYIGGIVSCMCGYSISRSSISSSDSLFQMKHLLTYSTLATTIRSPATTTAMTIALISPMVRFP